MGVGVARPLALPPGQHPGGKKFTRAAIRRGCQWPCNLSVVLLLRNDGRPGRGISEVCEAATGPIYIVPEFSSQSP